jgi:hypothetical protein
MKKTQLISILALTLLIFPNVTFARDSGGYVAFGLGRSQLSINSVDYTSLGASILIGAQANRNFAAEIEYIDFGALTGSISNITGNSKALSGVFLLPLTQRLTVYAKVGVSQVESFISGTGLTGLNTSISSFPYGAGVQFVTSPRSTLRIFADSGYNSQANGTTTTLTTNNYTGSIRRIGFSSLYTF